MTCALASYRSRLESAVNSRATWTWKTLPCSPTLTCIAETYQKNQWAKVVMAFMLIMSLITLVSTRAIVSMLTTNVYSMVNAWWNQTVQQWMAILLLMIVYILLIHLQDLLVGRLVLEALQFATCTMLKTHITAMLVGTQRKW